MPEHHATAELPPDADDSAYERYELREPAAVQALLRRMIEHRCTVSVRPASEPGAPPLSSVVSALLAVDARHLWVDVPRQESLLSGLLRHDQLSFDGYLDRVHVRFQCGPSSMDSQDGGPALRVPVPDRILHLQRRELLRREPPPGDLRCTLPARPHAEPPTQAINATIRDIGGGGVALLVPESAMKMKVGEVLRGCLLEMPGAPAFDVNLEICHVRELRQPAGVTQQAGCRFVNLPATAQSRLFRYLMQLDRERLSRR
jgi:c-di-GMP-binding flagellar brake protein YcgR